MTAHLLANFAISLGLTLLIEMPLAMLFGVRGKALWVVFLVNVLTNPLVNLLYVMTRTQINLPPILTQLFLEIPVVLAEWRVYHIFKKYAGWFEHPLVLSFVLNTVSYGIGLLLSL